MTIKYFKKKCITNVIKLLFAGIIIYFISKYIFNNINELKKYDFHINYLSLIISLLVCVLYLINQSFIWYIITKINKCNIDFFKTIVSRVYSEFGKYIPGKLFGYAMLLYSYDKENQSKKTVAYCMFFELLASVLAAVFIFILSLIFIEIPIFVKYRFVAILLLILFFIFIHPGILKYFSNIALKIFNRESVKFEFTYAQVLYIVSLYIINWFILGISFMVFINAIYPVPFQYYFYVTGSIAMAGLIGLFAIFVPAGLGVREGILTLALKEIMPLSFAGLISLASRLWLTLSEIILFLLVFIFSKRSLLKNQKGKGSLN